VRAVSKKKKWGYRATIYIKGKDKHRGYFGTRKQAAAAGGMNALIELEGSQTKGYFGLHTSDSFHPRKNLFLLTMVEELWW